jgi:tRNA(Ile2) C34 agmatinyltransferase TiaS
MRGFNQGQSSNSMFTPAQASVQCPAGEWLDNTLYSNVSASSLGGEAFVECADAQCDIGITVPGSASSQKFQEVADIVSDGIKHVMVLRLLGQVNEVRVAKPVTVQHKPQCTTCGKVNKANAKFCQECGTALELFV